MKQWLYIALLFSTVSMAHAGIRTPDGQLISTGHSVAKLIKYLGKPISKSSSYGCLNRRCSKKVRIESWIYDYDKRFWTIKIANGVIIDTEWTRSSRNQ